MCASSRRARQPPDGHGRRAAKVELIGGEPCRHPRGVAVVFVLSIEPVRLLSRVEHGVCIVEPPRCPAETFEGQRRLLDCRGPLEENARLFPSAVPKCFPSLLAGGLQRRHLTWSSLAGVGSTCNTSAFVAWCREPPRTRALVRPTRWTSQAANLATSSPSRASMPCRARIAFRSLAEIFAATTTSQARRGDALQVIRNLGRGRSVCLMRRRG